MSSSSYLPAAMTILLSVCGPAAFKGHCGDALTLHTDRDATITPVRRTGGHAPIMIPVSHRSTDRKELGVLPPVRRENARRKA